MTPLVAHKVADILADAGLPSGLFQIIHGTHKIGWQFANIQALGKFL